jgi:hypothetical protein
MKDKVIIVHHSLDSSVVSSPLEIIALQDLWMIEYIELLFK